MTTRTIPRLVLTGFVLLAGCGDQNAKRIEGELPPPGQHSTPAATSQTPEAAPAPTGAKQLVLAGVQFTVPSEWRDLGPAPMLQAKYLLAPVEGDELSAEINVAYYGASQGGEIEANLARWIGQMRTADGADASDIAIRSKLTTSNGIDIHFVEIDGTYMKSMGGGPMTGGRTQPQPGHRLVGAIVMGPEGNVFIKLVGPTATTRVMEQQLRAMLGEATKV